MESHTPKEPEKDPLPDSQEKEPKSPRKPLNVVSVPNDQDMIAQEMAELFEEDEVTHKHGSAEPEGD